MTDKKLKTNLNEPTLSNIHKLVLEKFKDHINLTVSELIEKPIPLSFRIPRVWSYIVKRGYENEILIKMIEEKLDAYLTLPNQKQDFIDMIDDIIYMSLVEMEMNLEIRNE